jgi:glycosyltransferase involved in cell wall biosynthesis
LQATSARAQHQRFTSALKTLFDRATQNSGEESVQVMTAIRRYREAGGDSAVAPEVALIVSNYHKPRHLQLSLASIAAQRGMTGRFELVVADDGSADESFEIIEKFAERVDFPITLTTHRHHQFQLAQCRNEGVAASTAEYLVFTDGDLILPPDFIWQHLRRRRRNTAYTGECYRLSEEVSAGIDEAVVQSGAYRNLVSPAELLRVRKYARLSTWQSLVRHRRKPDMLGGNIGISRTDFERVNGYDENFVGWGCEDDDLGHRLRRVGVRIRPINRYATAYHIWHPLHATTPTQWLEGPNVAYYLRRHRDYRCLNGLLKLGSAAPAQSPGQDEAENFPLPLQPQRQAA